jgi:hypothetical protein
MDNVYQSFQQQLSQAAETYTPQLPAEAPSPPDPPYSTEDRDQDGVDQAYICPITFEWQDSPRSAPIQLPPIDNGHPQFYDAKALRTPAVNARADAAGRAPTPTRPNRQIGPIFIQHPLTRAPILLSDVMCWTTWKRQSVNNTVSKPGLPGNPMTLEPSGGTNMICT